MIPYLGPECIEALLGLAGYDEFSESPLNPGGAKPSAEHEKIHAQSDDCSHTAQRITPNCDANSSGPRPDGETVRPTAKKARLSVPADPDIGILSALACPISMLQAFLRDLRYALRGFRRNPGFLLCAVTAICLGVGANTAIFSVIDAVLLQPLSYPDPSRIVRFVSQYPDGTSPLADVPEFSLWKAQKDVFEEVAAYDVLGPALNLTSGRFPEQIQGKHVTADFFHLFGAQVMLGRTFTEAEDRPRGGNWVVLSEGLWRRHFSSDPQIVGKSIRLGNLSFTVVGVISSQFRFDTPADVYLPCQFNLDDLSRSNQFTGAGRLRPRITLRAANARLQTLVPAYRQKLHLSDRHYGFSVESYRDSVVGDVRSSLLLLGGAVGMVLLIACANVASLLLARGAGRQPELATRAALGASRGRLILQLLTESVLLSLAGGMLGLVVGLMGVRGLLAVRSGDIPRIGQHGNGVVLDWRVLAFTMVISIGSGIVFGLIPALRVSRVYLHSVLRNGSIRTADRRHHRISSVFVTTEMALAVVLVIGALLLIRTFIALRDADPGFRSRNVTTMNMSVHGTRFQKTMPLSQMAYQAVDELEKMPGVEAAGITSSVPLTEGFGLPFSIVRALPQNSQGNARWISISPHYFDVFKIPVVRGRHFDDRDKQGSLPVVMINEAMARKYWPDSDPVGWQIEIGQGVGPDFADDPREIVGIAGNVLEDGLDQPSPPTMYLPLAQVPDAEAALNAEISPMVWAIRAQSGQSINPAVVEKKLTEASGGLPVGKVLPMDAILLRSTARSDFTMLLLAIFGGCALVLAAIGMYGLMIYSVEQRTHEIGIRIALGAGMPDVQRMIVAEGMRLALAGIGLGVAGAYWLTRLIASFLFGVQSRDPAVFLAVPLFLGLVALTATWVAARRATRVAPMEALRQS
jgi:putative ABC transport system permease protein